MNGNLGTTPHAIGDGTMTQGGYPTHVVDEDFVRRIPESKPFETVAPLLCAAVTTSAKRLGAEQIILMVSP